ncbi:MAG: FAD-dependent monooxygenase, partial [Pseudomonadota bacterium]
IRLGARLTDVQSGEDGARRAFADGSNIRTGVAVGADGLKSAVRTALVGPDEPAFSGHMAWRALIPMDLVSSDYAEARSTVCVGGGKNTVYYPVRNGALLNFVAFTRAEAWVEESWSEPASPDDLLETFSGWCEFALAPIRAIPPERCYRWGLFLREPLARWTDGTTVLLGDAAHPMLPFFGQGAACAIEDAVVLARCLEAYDDAFIALNRYEAARLPRASMLQRESNLGGERLQAFDPYALKKAPVKAEDSMGIFRYDPATVDI